MSSSKGNRKVYSPDITPYSMEGKSGVFGTLISLFVAPIRIVSRVMHNIFVLPANLVKDYANSLLVVGIVLEIIGVIDLLLFQKWPLCVSQVPVIWYALQLKNQAAKSVIVATKKREVDIDTEEVEELCNTIYKELDNIIKED